MPLDRDPSHPASANGRRRFLELTGSLVAAAPLAAALEAFAGADADAAAARKPRPAAPPADPFAAARPDLSLCRTAAERETLEKQWKGLEEALGAIRSAPLEASLEPATVFAALPREPAPGRRSGRGSAKD